METELQGCYILHVCAKELLAESERAISATVPQCHNARTPTRNIRANVSVNYEPPHFHLVCGVVGRRSENSPNYVKIKLELSVATRTYRHA
jgi:hypothetical protein